MCGTCRLLLPCMPRLKPLLKELHNTCRQAITTHVTQALMTVSGTQDRTITTAAAVAARPTEDQQACTSAVFPFTNALKSYVGKLYPSSAGPSAPPLPPQHAPPRAARTVGGGDFELLARQGSGGGFGNTPQPTLQQHRGGPPGAATAPNPAMGGELPGAATGSAWGRPFYPTYAHGGAYADGLNTVTSGRANGGGGGDGALLRNRNGGGGSGDGSGRDSPAPLQRHGSEALSTGSATDSPRAQLLGRSGLFNKVRCLCALSCGHLIQLEHGGIDTRKHLALDKSIALEALAVALAHPH